MTTERRSRATGNGMDPRLDARLRDLVALHDEILAQLADPEVLADQVRYSETARRHSELKPVSAAYRAYLAADAERSDAHEMAAGDPDAEMASYLAALQEEASAEMAKLEEQLRALLLPKDPNDHKDVIVEVRAAVGGEEAALWAADLYRMYQRYAEMRGWKIDPIDTSVSATGGLKEAVFAVKGEGAWSRLKYEAGPHRVQRVPKTESSGRTHTSVATVAVLPEAEAVEVELPDGDLVWDVFRSSGPGGQSVNTTDSAVRLTHKPTGIVVSCQDEKSQLQNKAKALRVLRARLLARRMAEQQSEIAANRRSQVGTGERAEKIRTYNFRENRVTDHRVGLTVKRLPEILDGNLDGIIDALIADDVSRRLAEGP